MNPTFAGPQAEPASSRAKSRVSAVSRLAGLGAAVVLAVGLAPSVAFAATLAQSTTPSAGDVFVPVTPFRIVDTRSGSGCSNISPSAPLGPGSTATVTVVGATACESTSGSVPSGATAVAVEVTAIKPTSPGYLTVWPAGTSQPTVSNVNFMAGQPAVANLAMVKLSSSGTLDVYNSAGTTNLAIDVEGYYVSSTSTAASSGDAYHAISPTRVCDTRSGNPSDLSGTAAQCNSAILAAQTPRAVQITGIGSIPTGATAVVLNLTVVRPSAIGFAVVYPKAGTTPTVSNINFGAGETIANRAVVALSSSGAIDLLSNVQTNAIIDVDGYFTAGPATGAQFYPVSPYRIVDTRSGSGCSNISPDAPLGDGTTSTVSVIGASGCEGTTASSAPSGTTAAVTNLTAVRNAETSAHGDFLTAFPATPMPVASDINISGVNPDYAFPNLGVETLSSSGTFDIYNFSGSVDFVVDVFGFFAPPVSVTPAVYPVSPGATTPTTKAASTTADPTSGLITYSVTGLPANSNVDIALFTDTGSDAPVCTSSGSCTFTSSAGAGKPGTAAGQEGTTATSEAFIAYVNGTPTDSGNNSSNTTGQVNDVTTSSSGTLGFALNSFSAADPIPVVFTPDFGNDLVVNSSGQPIEPYGVGGRASWTAVPTNEVYTLSGPTPSSTPTVSISSSPTSGEVTYTASGFTSSNTPDGYVDIALFPSSGTNAPVTTNGTTTFTSANGKGVAGPAAGEATTNNQTSTSVTSPLQGSSCVSNASCYGYIASVAGLATSGAPDLITDVAVTAGEKLTFVLNSFQPDGTIPVVFTEPFTTPTGILQLDTSGQPTTGYYFGVGASTSWVPPAAGSFVGEAWTEVMGVNTTNGTFYGKVLGSAGGDASSVVTTGDEYSFTYSTSGSTYSYTDKSTLTESEFSADLTAADPTQVVPGSTTALPVVGSEVVVGGEPDSSSTALGYTAGAPSTFAFDATDSPGYGNVPGAPTSVSASYSADAFLNSSNQFQAGIVVTWKPPVNPDVSGSQAVADNTAASTYSGDATYTLYASQVVNGTPQPASEVGSVTAVNPTVTKPTNLTGGTTSYTSPELIDTTNLVGGDSYIFYVFATAATGTNGGGQSGVFSQASSSVTVPTTVVPAVPAITSVAITPSTGYSTTTTVGIPTNVPSTATAGSAAVVYDEAVTCTSSAASDFSYTDSSADLAGPGAGVSALSPTGCAQLNDPANPTLSADTLVLTFPKYVATTETSSGTTVYETTPVATPSTGDVFTYTEPSSPTTTDAVYETGTSSSPQFATTQSATDNGQSNTGSAVSNPLFPANEITVSETAATATSETVQVTASQYTPDQVVTGTTPATSVAVGVTIFFGVDTVSGTCGTMSPSSGTTSSSGQVSSTYDMGPSANCVISANDAYGDFGNYTPAAATSISMSPTPIASTGSLGDSASVTVTLTTQDGAAVWLSFSSGATPAGSATVDGTALTSTPTEFIASSSGTITIDYTSSSAATLQALAAPVDTITAQNAATSPTVTTKDTYTY